MNANPGKISTDFLNSDVVKKKSFVVITATFDHFLIIHLLNNTLE